MELYPFFRQSITSCLVWPWTHPVGRQIFAYDSFTLASQLARITGVYSEFYVIITLAGERWGQFRKLSRTSMLNGNMFKMFLTLFLHIYLFYANEHLAYMCLVPVKVRRSVSLLRPGMTDGCEVLLCECLELSPSCRVTKVLACCDVSLAFFCGCFDSRSRYIALVCLEFTMYTRLAPKLWWFSCLCLPSTGIKRMHHYRLAL